MLPCPSCELAHAPEIACGDALKKQLRAVIKNVGNPGQCRSCGAKVLWILHRNGKATPYTLAGGSHFADCPDAATWSKKAVMK